MNMSCTKRKEEREITLYGTLVLQASAAFTAETSQRTEEAIRHCLHIEAVLKGHGSVPLLEIATAAPPQVRQSR